MTLDEFIEECQKLQAQGCGKYEVRLQVVGESGIWPKSEDAGKPHANHIKKHIII